VKKLAINTGFTTNSSSRVVHVPQEVLDLDPVRDFMETYNIEDGFIGDHLYYRSSCGSLLVSRDQKETAQKRLDEFWEDSEFEPNTPDIRPDEEDKAVIIYGDEYTTIASELLQIIESHTDQHFRGQQYN
jgi:hypothetical protein